MKKGVLLGGLAVLVGIVLVCVNHRERVYQPHHLFGNPHTDPFAAFLQEARVFRKDVKRNAEQTVDAKELNKLRLVFMGMKTRGDEFLRWYYASCEAGRLSPEQMRLMKPVAEAMMPKQFQDEASRFFWDKDASFDDYQSLAKRYGKFLPSDYEYYQYQDNVP
jgi:hypothetical protein